MPPARMLDNQDDLPVVHAQSDELVNQAAEDQPSSSSAKDMTEPTLDTDKSQTRARRGCWSTFTSIYRSAKGDENDDSRGFWLALCSNLLFLNGSVFFLWLAILDLQWAKDVEECFESINERKSWPLWIRHKYRSSFECQFDDDYVYESRDFHWVSKYQIGSFIASASFMIEGFVDFLGTPGIRGLCMIFAGTFGLMSSWLGERDPDLSSIFGLMSAHLFVLEALGLVIGRCDFTGKIRLFVDLNDYRFVTATTIDVVLSYFELFGKYNMKIAKADLSSASLWLFCAVLYVGATLFAKRQGYFDDDDEESLQEEKSVSGDESPKENKIVFDA